MSKYGYICRKFLKTIKDKCQYIFVDKMSMITKDSWKRLCLLKMETNITFLLFGDEKQCPSVEDKTSKITLIPQQSNISVTRIKIYDDDDQMYAKDMINNYIMY